MIRSFSYIHSCYPAAVLHHFKRLPHLTMQIGYLHFDINISFLFSPQSRQIPPVMCRQIPDQDHYYRSDHHGRHSSPQPVCPDTGNSPYNGCTGINMAHKNIWRYSCHHITDQTASNSCDSPKKYKKKYSSHISLGNPLINTHNGKYAKSNRIHHQHHLIID